jgi:YidC/Oxa1 family membrane protein insertase
MHKMRSLNEQLKQLQCQYRDDPQALSKAQLELYRKHGINPISGCLPQLLQLFMLIIVYQAINQLINMQGLAHTNFLWFDLLHPDSLYLIPVIATVSQFLLSLMMLPAADCEPKNPDKSSKKSNKALQKSDVPDSSEMAATMQKQMTFMMPIFTGVITLTLPAGLGLYWVVSTIFSIGQQYFISGLGGLAVYYKRFFTRKPSTSDS